MNRDKEARVRERAEALSLVLAQAELAGRFKLENPRGPAVTGWLLLHEVDAILAGIELRDRRTARG